MPSVKGEARGFLYTAWAMTPDPPSKPPTMTPTSTRLSLSQRVMESTSGLFTPSSIFKASRKVTFLNPIDDATGIRNKRPNVSTMIMNDLRLKIFNKYSSPTLRHRYYK